MRHYKILLIGSVVLCVVLVALAGCGISQSEYEALQSENANLVAELAEMKEVYPPRDFSSLGELRGWLMANDISEKPDTQFIEDWYGRALEVQEAAARDGYLVSVDYDYYEEDDTYNVWCATVIDGYIWFWDPETDEAFQDEDFGVVE
ncbi:hypothetical protein ACFLWK_01275 [Chloroflexota bacterium]